MADKYSPRSFAEDPIPRTVLTEPVPPDNVRSIVRAERRPLHAVLVESLNNTQALLTRLESGVCAPRDQEREIVQQLYVQTRQQLKVQDITDDRLPSSFVIRFADGLDPKTCHGLGRVAAIAGIIEGYS
jgi:hypothetical protein